MLGVMPPVGQKSLTRASKSTTVRGRMGARQADGARNFSMAGGSRPGALRWAAAGALCAAALLIAACGDDDDSEPEARDLTALYCPLPPGNDPTAEPPEGSFNTAELIGLELSEAAQTAAEHDCEIVVSVADGKGRPVPIELNRKRIYVYTKDDVVTQIEGVGGGI